MRRHPWGAREAFRLAAPASVLGVVLVLLLGAVPAFGGPRAAAASLEGGSFSFDGPAYSVDLAWPDVVTSLSEGGAIFDATIQLGAREGQLTQSLQLGDVFFEAFGLVNDRFFVRGATSTSGAGEPVLTLDVSRTPVEVDVPEIRGRVTLTFGADAIRHEQEFHLPNAAFAASIFSTTRLAWSAPFDAHGSVRPGGAVAYDDGSSLDAYGAWEATGTYGVFVQDEGALVGHARLRQGEMLNYLGDGSFRVDEHGSVVRSIFTGFLDSPTTGLNNGLYAVDAIVLGATPPTPEAYAARIAELARPPATARWFDPASVDEPTPTGPIPHVLVGIPDSGINPYHEIYYRPNLTVHPCTYLPGFPCEIPALPLSVGVHESWEDAYAADKALWDALVPRQWYWIPKTVFVAAMCEGSTSISGGPGLCLIDDTNMHGTGTTSSVLTENPNALIAFKEGNSATAVFEDGLLPIDIISYSWGAAVPLATPLVLSTPRDYTPFFIAASGNEGAFPVVLDTDKASQAVINVGAADAATRSEPGYSGWKTMDYVSQYCRPTAQTKSIREYRDSYCGTSFSAPTFAGALSKIVLDLRRQSGYTGAIVDQMVDPVLGVSKWDVRDALNRTATYTPEARFPAQGGGVPVPAEAPWYQWGWGYVDSTVVDDALACILEEVCPEKPTATTAYMDALWAFRDVSAGWTAFDAYSCSRGDDRACDRLPEAVRAAARGAN